MKHSLMMEALAEEASSLDVKHQYSKILHNLPCEIRAVERDITDKKSMKNCIYRKKVAQKLRSPYIIAPLEVSDDTSDNGNLYIIFEYITGGTLESLLKKR